MKGGGGGDELKVVGLIFLRLHHQQRWDLFEAIIVACIEESASKTIMPSLHQTQTTPSSSSSSSSSSINGKMH
ncbi:conserved hypothetical protein [Ricinus communis]|uniref:Uncharacterized protein n=1 Tax=Ricinus communis TaxID=3988 RepID=B9S403_RICCO|nr:conserved hypothetical protein [Ricinus communis]